MSLGVLGQLSKHIFISLVGKIESLSRKILKISDLSVIYKASADRVIGLFGIRPFDHCIYSLNPEVLVDYIQAKHF